MEEPFEYRDLLVRVWTDPVPGFFTARAWEEFGRSTPPVQIRLPLDDRQFIAYVDRLGELNAVEMQYVGARLFDALFQGDILRLYVHLREQLQPAGERLRVRLEIDPPIAARLPWECLYDTREGSFLGSRQETTLVRYLESATAPKAVAIRLPLRIVLAAECPESHSTARVVREASAVREALRALEAEGLITVQCVGTALDGEPLTQEALVERLRRDVDVLHLIADTRWVSGEATVELMEEGGKAASVSAGSLASALEATSPRLVVLSGGSAAGAVGPALAERLLLHTPALLSHRGNTPEDLLERFVSMFYRSLAAMMSVDGALTRARGEVALHFPVEIGWLAPALFLAQRDARLFYNQARERVQQVYQLSEGKYRRRLRETLNRIWPKPERYTKELLRWMPRQEPMTSYLHAADFLGKPQSPQELTRRFQRLMILGEPGAGKTMTLYRLFYEAAQPILSYRAKSPLPLYLSLPDLTEGTSLFDFIGRGLDRELFASDLAEGRFLFLMDAADGLSALEAQRLLTALNEFMHRFPANRFVVAARRAVPGTVEIANWAELVPFADWESLDFLIDEDAIRAEPARLLYRQLARSLGARVGNPQVLAMARRLWREGARVPDTTTRLFLAFFRVAGQSLVPELREGLLPRLALFMTERDRISLTRQQLEAELASCSRDKGPLGETVWHALAPPEEGELLLEELAKTRLLRGPQPFSFPSIAFQEFLSALALRSIDPEKVLELVPTARWELHDERPLNLARGPLHGVLPFFSGLVDDAAPLVEGLIGRDLVLAAECFREASRSAAGESLARSTDAALASGDPLTARVACVSLEARGDLGAIESLERAVSQPYHPARALAAEALGTLHSHHSLPLLKAAALEKDPAVSRAAMGALARIKAS